MVLLNYSMVTAISMTKQPSPYHSIHFIYTHHRLWQALESNLSDDRYHGDPNPTRHRRNMLFSLDQDVEAEPHPVAAGNSRCVGLINS
jgi:hypothetical protein